MSKQKTESDSFDQLEQVIVIDALNKYKAKLEDYARRGLVWGFMDNRAIELAYNETIEELKGGVKND